MEHRHKDSTSIEKNWIKNKVIENVTTEIKIINFN